LMPYVKQPRNYLKPCRRSAVPSISSNRHRQGLNHPRKVSHLRVKKAAEKKALWRASLERFKYPKQRELKRG